MQTKKKKGLQPKISTATIDKLRSTRPAYKLYSNISSWVLEQAQHDASTT